MDSTVVFYTANREHPAFTEKVKEKLLQSIGDLPLITVSQKPMPGFGQNICVGELPWCDASAFHQLRIGMEAAKTKFIIAAESDCVYPPEYFTFTPPLVDQVYRYTSVYIMYSYSYGKRSQGKAWKKSFSEGAQMCGREHWLRRITHALKEFPMGDHGSPPHVFDTKDRYQWYHPHPMVSFKTSGGLRKHTGVGGRTGAKGFRDFSNCTDELPYWGNVQELRRELCGEWV